MEVGGLHADGACAAGGGVGYGGVGGEVDTDIWGDSGVVRRCTGVGFEFRGGALSVIAEAVGPLAGMVDRGEEVHV